MLSAIIVGVFLVLVALKLFCNWFADRLQATGKDGM